jgi:2-polyprenyl-3-methyl-5-hydroxy-6-metoxy-1,4-benzoquinol methylase
MDEILNEKYDFIVFADVIEHIDNPINVLKNFFEKIDYEKTKVIISTPNVAFGAVRLSLMQGSFNYVDSGILEKTHLRFYTLESLKLLMSNLNLNIEKLYYLNRNFNNTETNLNDLKLNPLLIYFVSKDRMSHVYQFLLVLSKKNILTEERIFGNKSNFPILEYIFKPIVVKNQKVKGFMKKFYKL